MSFLAELKRETKKIAPFIVFYSFPGGGKTSLASQFKDVVFLHDENDNGLLDLMSNGIARNDIPHKSFKTLQDIRDAVSELRTQKHDFKWLAIDGWTGVQRVLFQEVCDTLYNGDFGKEGFLSFNQGPKASLPTAELLISDLEKLRTETGMGIIVLAHAAVKSFDDPRLGKYDKFGIDCNEHIEGALFKAATIIGFLDYVTAIKGKGGDKIATGGTIRELHLCRTAAFEAKNRNNVTEPISMGNTAEEAYANLRAAMQNKPAA